SLRQSSRGKRLAADDLSGQEVIQFCEAAGGRNCDVGWLVEKRFDDECMVIIAEQAHLCRAVKTNRKGIDNVIFDRANDLRRHFVKVAEILWNGPDEQDAHRITIH